MSLVLPAPHAPAPHAPAPLPQRHSPLALWHLLSLDAPTVAALWTYFIARSCGIALPRSSTAAMFVAVWMLYAADRLLDARRLEHFLSARDLEERHRFHHRHRTAFLAGIGVCAGLLAAFLPSLATSALRFYAILASLLAAYFVTIHVTPSDRSHVRLPKEIAVGLFFSAAVFIPVVAEAPALRPVLAPHALLFAAVCVLNCLYVYAWEHPGPRPSAHWTTRWATQHLSAMGLAIALCGFALTALAFVPSFVSAYSAPMPAHLYLLSLGCAFAALLLRLLHGFHDRFLRVTLRAAADFMLLTPLLLLPWL